MRRASSIPRQYRIGRWAAALVLSTAAHAWWLGGLPVSTSSPVPMRAVSARMIDMSRPVAAPPLVPAKRPVRPRPTLPEVSAEATPPAPPPDAEPVRVAPAIDWTYLLRQGDREGTARLNWLRQDDGYRLLLTRELDGKPLPAWRSEGGLDAQQGLLPRRYATQRQDRQGGWQDSQATNFRREEGLISFSASREQFALAAGVQDRLSWWLQLAARVAGAPQRFGAGGEIRISVAGLRGEPVDWRFDILGEEALILPMQVVPAALHLRRAALGPYDGAIDIWLDPTRDHLPVKVAVGLADERGWVLELLDGLPPR